MKMLTKAILKSFETTGSQENVMNVADLKVHVKYFHPVLGWEWYGIKYYPEYGLFWGLVIGMEREYGDFTLEQLEQFYVAGLKPERDMMFKPSTLGELGLV